MKTTYNPAERKKVLNKDVTDILNSRVMISRETRIFNLRDVSNGWNLGYMSIYRYQSPALREASLEDARRAYLEHKVNYKPGQCDCGTSYKTHVRCKDCTSLIHTEVNLCGSCVASRLRKSQRQ